MAGKDLEQHIQITGGKEAEQTFKSLGDAGVREFTRIKEAGEKAANFSQIGQQFVQVSNAIGKLGRDVDGLGKIFSRLGDDVKTVGSRFLGAATAAAGLAAGFLAIVKSAGDAGQEIQNAAAAAGLSAKRYQELQGAFRLAGVSADSFNGLMTKLNKAMGDQQVEQEKLRKAQKDLSEQYLNGEISADQYVAALNKMDKEQREQINTFTKLGLNVKRFGNDAETALEQTLQALAAMPKGIERTRAELELFGRTGNRVEAVIRGGIKAYREYQEELKRLAPALGETLLNDLDRVGNSFEKVGLVTNNLKLRLAAVFAPDVANVVESFAELLVRLRVPILELALSIQARLKPVLDDIAKFFRGEEVTPGGFVETMIIKFNQLKEVGGVVLEYLVAAWRKLIFVMDLVAPLFNKVFGTNVTGEGLAIALVIAKLTGLLGLLADAIFAPILAFGKMVSIIKDVITVFEKLRALWALMLANPLVAGITIAVVALGLAIYYLATQTTFFQDTWQKMLEIWQGTVEIFTQVTDGIKAAWDSLVNGIAEVAHTVLDPIVQFIEYIAKKWQALKDSFTAGGAGSNMSEGDIAAAGAGAGGAAFAGGGYVRGRGTATSDSILARLSDGEFVQRTRAVQYYGREFMAKLNNLQIPKAVFEGLRGFAQGGFVHAMAVPTQIPGFASGGMVDAVSSGGGRPFTLQIGGETIHGLTADGGAVDKLQKLAAKKQLAQSGLKPSWFYK